MNSMPSCSQAGFQHAAAVGLHTPWKAVARSSAMRADILLSEHCRCSAYRSMRRRKGLHQRKKAMTLTSGFGRTKSISVFMGNTTPLCDTTPPLNAMMHGDVLNVTQFRDVCKRKFNRIFNQSPYL